MNINQLNRILYLSGQNIINEDASYMNGESIEKPNTDNYASLGFQKAKATAERRFMSGSEYIKLFGKNTITSAEASKGEKDNQTVPEDSIVLFDVFKGIGSEDNIGYPSAVDKFKTRYSILKDYQNGVPGLASKSGDTTTYLYKRMEEPFSFKIWDGSSLNATAGYYLVFDGESFVGVRPDVFSNTYEPI
jgi:hypothetical protein